ELPALILRVLGDRKSFGAVLSATRYIGRKSGSVVRRVHGGKVRAALSQRGHVTVESLRARLAADQSSPPGPGGAGVVTRPPGHPGEGANCSRRRGPGGYLEGGRSTCSLRRRSCPR